MSRTRLEAFSDAVIAIIMTIMVLELRPPHEATLAALVPLTPVFLSYVLSFLTIGTYWNNHHHMMHMVTEVGGAILWANLMLLFCLSLFPFVTGWMGESHFAPLPTALFGVENLFCGLSFYVLQQAVFRKQGKDSPLRAAVGRDWKGKLSVAAYACATPIAFFAPWVAWATFVVVALMWIIPDARIERALAEHRAPGA